MVSTVRPFENPIPVARPALPPLDEFRRGLEGIWSRAWLTNNGPLVQAFRESLLKFCGVECASLLTNGTLGLQMGIQAMGITGEVITTPYTFVATTHALISNRIRPRFVDIEPTHYSIDPDRIEEAITPRTSAILAVHVYGQPCRLERLQNIARKHGLSLLFDAAHAFGVEVARKPIGSFGDMSLFSFHATKIFHSIEGGMLTFREKDLERRLDYLKNFGFENETEVVMPGGNAKMTELQALMGMLLLPRVHAMIGKRRDITQHYRRRLAEIPGIQLPAPPAEGVRYNYAYLPVEIDQDAYGMSRDDLYFKLREYNVLARRYFYPIVPDLSCYRAMFRQPDLTVARRVASRILVLPLYSDLQIDDVHQICDIIEYLHAQGRQDVAPRHADTLICEAEPALMS